ncbi:hypothetical protein VE02_01150 [Pseudogymnoascus sp. 03VT05]|nr:hypothetical protein VE02_01150 [Pseudogymnoascus sp. 03VT05]
MRFISALLAGALAAVAAAQTTGSQPNPFTNTDFSGIAAGSPITITWTPTTQGTVTLELVHSDTGNSNDLKPVATIQASISNSGSYTWTPDSSIVNGGGYALKIVDDANPDEYNYTLQFHIKTDTQSAAPTSASSTEAPTSTAAPSSSTAAPSSSTTEESSTTSEVTTSTEVTSTNASSTTDASTTAHSTTTSAPTTTSHAATTSSSKGAAATGGAKVGAGLMGFVGAAMLLL